MKRQHQRMSGHRRFQKPARRSRILSDIAAIADCPPKQFYTTCGRSCRDNTKLPKSSANGFGWTFHPLASPFWQGCFGRWASIGINGAASGNIPAAALTRSAVIPPTRAPSIVVTFPPMFYQLESHVLQATTVSEFVS